jgi:chemotaxis protein MotB
MARKKKEECKAPPAWLTSFGDLMSLLLTFFILLYSMSTISLEKFYQAIKGIIKAFGGHYVIYEERVIPVSYTHLTLPTNA